VAERVGSVAQLAAGDRVPRLGRQADVVADRQHPLEGVPRPARLSGRGERVGVPQRAVDERALAVRRAVPGPRIAPQESLALQRRHRAHRVTQNVEGPAGRWADSRGPSLVG